MRMTASDDLPVAMLHYEMGTGVQAFSTMRQGAGISQGNYACFNINKYCGDTPAAIRHNRALLCRVLGVSDEHLVFPHQTHGTVVRAIDHRFFSMTTEARKAALEGVDALMTDLRGVCIGVSTADCIPVLLYDAEHHAVCAIHAGWRGTVARIVSRAVHDMTEVYGSRPDGLRAAIGPGISLKNFEVGDEVYLAFADAGFDMPRISKRYDKWHIDLPRCNQLQLAAAGVPLSQICPSGVCTYDSCHQFFSARRLGLLSGRIFTGILLR